MNILATSLVFFATLMASPLVAADEIKTLPPAMYESMKSGKKLDKVFVGPEYSRTQGFSLGDLEYKAEERSVDLKEYIPRSIGDLAKPKATNKLHLTVVEYKICKPGFFANVGADGYVVLEGRIVNADGTLVAAFRAKGKYNDLGRSGRGHSFRDAVDQIASAIAKDLL